MGLCKGLMNPVSYMLPFLSGFLGRFRTTFLFGCSLLTFNFWPLQSFLFMVFVLFSFWWRRFDSALATAFGWRPHFHRLALVTDLGWSPHFLPWLLLSVEDLIFTVRPWMLLTMEDLIFTVRPWMLLTVEDLIFTVRPWMLISIQACLFRTLVVNSLFPPVWLLPWAFSLEWPFWKLVLEFWWNSDFRGTLFFFSGYY